MLSFIFVECLIFANFENFFDALMNKLNLENIDLDNLEFQNAWNLIRNTHRSVFLTGRLGQERVHSSGISVKTHLRRM